MENLKQRDSLESDDDVIPSLTASSERSDSLESDDEILPKRDSLESDDEILSAPKTSTKLKRNRCHNFECDNRDENSKARRQRQLGSQTYVETLGKLMECSPDNETRPNTSHKNDRTATERRTRRKRNHHYLECGNENPRKKRLEAVECFVDKTTCKGSSSSSSSSSTKEDEEEEEEEVTIPTPTATDTLLQAEAKDLDDLTTVAAEATVIQFDKTTGRPSRFSQSREENDNEDSLSHPIRGLVKITRAMMLQNDPDLFWELSQIHSIVKKKVHLSQMVPWAGIGADSTRLRSFGFLGKESLYRLDHQSDVRLYAPEKQGKDALLDEQANRRAICVLHKTRERVVCDDAADHDEHLPMVTTKKTVNPTRVADKLCAVILGNNNTNQRGETISSNNVNSDLSQAVLCSEELIAYQTNLHNGAQHLSAHLDAPLHEGFGKVIVTVAIRGSATILLIGKGDGSDDNSYNDDEDQDDDDDEEERGDSTQLQEQPAWKFHLQEGEAYVLSGNARNISLHAVISDNSSGGDRESLNLRFGLHSVQEAENDIRKHWPGLW